MRIPRRAAMLALAAAAGLPHAALAASVIITGTVSYRERIALPPGARLEVKLLDVSLADAPSATLAGTSVAVRRGPPIPYRLRLDRSRIQPGRSYALQARILVHGRLWFTTAERHTVFGGGPDRTDIVVVRAGSGAERSDGPAGRWLAEDILGGGVVDRLQTVLELGADGSVSGSGGCNRMGGRASIAGDRITFGNIVATMKACPPAVMNQEGRFLSALRSVRSWRLDPAARKLTLLDEAGRALVVFSRMGG